MPSTRANQRPTQVPTQNLSSTTAKQNKKSKKKTTKANSKNPRPHSGRGHSDSNLSNEFDADEEEDAQIESDQPIINRQSRRRTLVDKEDEQGLAQKSQTTRSNKKAIFRSRFPGLEIDTYEDCLDDWTVDELRQNIAKQASRSSKAPQDIKSLVKTIRLEYEKRMLMAALMGAVPEIVVWNIV